MLLLSTIPLSLAAQNSSAQGEHPVCVKRARNLKQQNYLVNIQALWRTYIEGILQVKIWFVQKYKQDGNMFGKGPRINI